MEWNSNIDDIVFAIRMMKKKKKKKEKKRNVGEGFRYGEGLGRLPNSAACSAVSTSKFDRVVNVPKPISVFTRLCTEWNSNIYNSVFVIMMMKKKKKKKEKKRKVGKGFRYGGGLGRLPNSATCSAVSITRRAMLV